VLAFLTRATARWFWIGFVGFGTLAVVGWFVVAMWFTEPADECFRGAMNAVLARFPLSGHNQMTVGCSKTPRG
jgi:hypothetical protein